MFGRMSSSGCSSLWKEGCGGSGILAVMYLSAVRESKARDVEKGISEIDARRNKHTHVVVFYAYVGHRWLFAFFRNVCIGTVIIIAGSLLPLSVEMCFFRLFKLVLY